MANTPLSRFLGSKLRALREARRMVLKDLEQCSGISATHISEIERGKTSPTIAALERVAKALGTSSSYLLELPPVDRLHVMSPEERQVLKDNDERVFVERLSELWGGDELILHRLRLKPGAMFAGEAPPSEDMLIVLRGTVGVRIGQDWQHLNSGDTLHLRTREPVHVANSEDTEAELLWARCLGCHL